jgi:putative transposase
MSAEDMNLDMRKHVPPEGRASARPVSSPYRRHPIHLPPSERHNRSTIIFVTVCTAQRRRILTSPHAHEAIVGAWTLATKWLVGRYVILPDHVHFFCAPNDPFAPSLEVWMRYLKSIVTRNLGEIGGSVWQRDHWDRQLRRGESYDEKWEYVGSNPVRHQLISKADDWLYQGELNELRW